MHKWYVGMQDVYVYRIVALRDIIYQNYLPKHLNVKLKS